MSVKRLVPVFAAAALSATALIALPGTAADAAPGAAALQCDTLVTGTLPSGRLVQRDVVNTRVTGEKKTAAALPFKAESMYGGRSDAIAGGRVFHYFVHAPGQPAKQFDATEMAGSSTLTIKINLRYRPTPAGRLFADSGRFYTYGVAPSGALTRWTRYTDNAGHYWIANPKTVRTGMGSLKTLSYMFTYAPGGSKRDLLYGTTSAGALKQIVVPWGTPGKPKITTVKKTGFSQYTGLSTSWCNVSGTIGSLVAIDKTHNQARWYTLGSQFRPSAANLVRHPLIAPGTNWRLHATF